MDIKQNEGPYDRKREKQDNGPMAILAYVLILHYGLDIDLYGQVSLSKDPVTLAHLDHSQLQTPSISNISSATAGPRESKPEGAATQDGEESGDAAEVAMDHISIK